MQREPRELAIPAGVMGNWSFSGKLGVRSPENHANLQIRWSQDQARYAIVISTVLGQGVARIAGTGNAARVELLGEEPVESDDLAGLTEERLGWRFPVSQILFWLNGYAAPGSPFSVEHDADGRLSSLRQAGWTIQYQRYGAKMPEKILFSTNTVELLLVIKEWRALDSPQT